MEGNRIQRYGRYSFRGTAPKKGAKWHVLLQVLFKRQGQHRRKVSRDPLHRREPRYPVRLGEAENRLCALTRLA